MRRLAALATAAVGLLAVLLAAPAVADAPNSCRAATVNRAQGVWLSDAISSGSDVDWFRFTTTTDRWTLVTLGSLSANLSLALFNGSCQQIAASNHAGARFEEIFRELPAGRYVARVSGVAGARSSYQLRLRGLRSGDDVLSSHTWRQNGASWIAGEVLNNRDQPWFMRYIELTMYDKAGHVLGHDEPSFPIQYTRAHRRAQFLDEFDLPAGYDHYRLRVVSEQPQGSFPQIPTTFIPGTAFTDSAGWRHYPGQLRNDGTQPIILPQVMYTLYGSRAQVLNVGIGLVSPDTLRPQRLGTYDVVFETAAAVNAVVRRAITPN